MAAPNPGAIPAAQGVQIHFWDRNGEAHALLQLLYHLPAGPSREDIVDHIWAAICRTYFPNTALATTPNGRRWTVLREPYRGPPVQLPAHKPNILVVRLHRQQVTGGFRVRGRDYLWVECKASTHDSSGGWKNLINETTNRLVSAHPPREVAVIVAIGFKMMAFWWDPNSTAFMPQLSIQATPPLTMVWNLDPRLKRWPGGNWVNQTNGRIGLSRALNADCFTPDRVNNQLLKWRNHHPRIEQLLLLIRNAQSIGLNANHWSC